MSEYPEVDPVLDSESTFVAPDCAQTDNAAPSLASENVKPSAEKEPQSATVEQKTAPEESPKKGTEPVGPVKQENVEPENDEEPAVASEPKIATLKAENAQLADDLARARADLYNLRQEYQGYVRRTKAEFKQHQEAGQRKVLNDLLDVLDAVFAADQAGELVGPFAAIANKLENTLETNYGLTRFGAPGEAFDPNCHEALLANESEEVTEPQIATVLQPGYQIGSEVLRATRVIVNNPA